MQIIMGQDNMKKFIPKIIQNCEKVYTNLWFAKRDWIFVEITRAILKIGTSSKINDKYNIPNKTISIPLHLKICSQLIENTIAIILITQFNTSVIDRRS